MCIFMDTDVSYSVPILMRNIIHVIELIFKFNNVTNCYSSRVNCKLGN